MKNDIYILNLLLSDQPRDQDKGLLDLYQRNRHPIQNYILRNSGSQEDAEEVLQDALVALFINSRKAGFKLTAKLDTYLYSIARNIWYKKLRKRSREPQFKIVDLLEIKGSYQLGEQDKTGESPLFNMIKKMSSRCSEILTMIYLREMGIKEIQEALGYQSEQAVRNKKSNCLGKLRAEYQEKGKAK